MRKEVFGLTKKELLVVAFSIAISLILITYSSIKMISNYYVNNNKAYVEIKNQSKCLTYLNSLNTYALNTQRNSVNILAYRDNLKEIFNFKKNILANNDSLQAKLNQINNSSFSLKEKKINLLHAGLTYLNINKTFLRLQNSNINTNKLSEYNLDKMRPAFRAFSDLIRKDSETIAQKIQYTNNNHVSVFSGIEFWLLLIGLAPYLYFSFRIMLLIVRMIFLEIFS